MANFKVGDEVVCVDAIFTIPDPLWGPLIRGGKYRVLWMNDLCVSVQKAHIPIDLRCERCGVNNGYVHDDPWRFIKLDGLQDETLSTEKLEA